MAKGMTPEERRRRRKRRERARRGVRERLFEQTRETVELPVVRGQRPAGMIKLSDALQQLFEPLRPGEMSPEALRSLATLTSMAWNLSLFPEEEQAQTLKTMSETLARSVPGGDVHVFRNIITSLVARKRELFPDDRRVVTATEVSGSGDTLRLDVAYAL